MTAPHPPPPELLRLRAAYVAELEAIVDSPWPRLLAAPDASAPPLLDAAVQYHAAVAGRLAGDRAAMLSQALADMTYHVDQVRVWIRRDYAERALRVPLAGGER